MTGQFRNSSAMEMRDADGVLIEIAVNTNLTDPQVTSSPRSRSFGDKQTGMETKDSHGLLVEVTHNLDNQLSSISVSKQTKIINGQSTQRSSYPFIVRLHSFDPGNDPDNSPSSFYCSGTLISPDVILTAAHCIGDEVYSDIYSVERKETITYKITKSVVHPKYQMEFFGYDFALARIDETHVKVATVPNYEGNEIEKHWELVKEFNWVSSPPIMRLQRYNQHSTSCTTLSRTKSKQITSNLKVLGFGLLSFPKGPISYPSLQSADVHYLPNEECNKMYLKAPSTAVANKEEGIVVTKDMLCANNIKEKQDACSGDSGGPLLAKLPTLNSFKPASWSLIGIVSWGIGCSLSKYPGVYSRVASEIDWIENTICDKNSGLSPLSCVGDENGRYHLRDYADEASSRNKRRSLSPRHSRPKSAMNDNSPHSLLSRKRIQLNFSFSVSGATRQSSANQKACELLEGNYMTSSPTQQPTSRLQNGRPTKLGIGLSISCHRNNKSDVRSFIDDNNKVRNCFWVKSKCRSRCGNYSSCCPETCSQKRCQQ